MTNTTEEGQLRLSNLHYEGESEGDAVCVNDYPPIEVDNLPPAPLLKADFAPQEAFQGDVEFQEQSFHEDGFNVPEVDRLHFYKDNFEVKDDNKDYFENQEDFMVQKHSESLEQIQIPEHHEHEDQFENRECFEKVEVLDNPVQPDKEIQQSKEEYQMSETELETLTEQQTLQELLYANEHVEHTDHILETPVGCVETPQGSESFDNAHVNLVGGTNRFTVEKQEPTLLHTTENKMMMNDFDQESSVASSEHVIETKRHTADTLDVVVNEKPSVPQQALELPREDLNPSFQEIKRDLEKKNIVGSLQSQPRQTYQRAGVVDMESPRGGGYSSCNANSHTNSSETPSYSNYQPPHNDSSSQHKINRGDNREGGRNAPAGVGQVRQTVALSDLQLSHATVFTDRAELVRMMTPVFKAGEIVEMLLENVSSAIVKDSIRVELRGAATILDVAYTTHTVPDMEETWAQSAADLQTELRQCHRQIDAIVSRLARLEKQRIVLDNFANSMTKKTEEEVIPVALTQPSSMPPPPQHDKRSEKHGKRTISSPEDSFTMDQVKRYVSELSNQANPYDPTHMDTLQRFLTLYEVQAERLDANLLSSKEELDRTGDRAEQIEKELAILEKRSEENLVREISVLIEPREDGPVDMLVTYVVERCRWKPAYDIRLFNSDGSMKIIYYGLIQQWTGEDWEPRRMTLSTAHPSSEGVCPHLGLQRLHYKQTTPQPYPLPTVPSTAVVRPPRSASSAVRSKTPRSLSQNQHQHPFLSENGSYVPESPRMVSTALDTLQRAPSYNEPWAGTLRGSSISREASRQALGTSLLIHSAPPNEPQNTPVSKTTPSTVATVIFEVPRPPIIVPCNNEEVRVTVGLIDLQPSYDYVTVPKRSLSAFLKANVKNSSNFYILPGPTNIYSDNTFIGKSELGAIAPGEDLSCDLGAEAGIEVIYRPMFKSKENASGQKTTVSFKQIIDVRNTFQRPVRLMVVDQLPSSGEDKIKVNLIEPNIRNPEKYDKKKPIRMNKHHNIEWDLDLHAGEAREVVLRYTVEYPAVEELEVSVAEE